MARVQRLADRGVALCVLAGPQPADVIVTADRVYSMDEQRRTFKCHRSCGRRAALAGFAQEVAGEFSVLELDVELGLADAAEAGGF